MKREIKLFAICISIIALMAFLTFWIKETGFKVVDSGTDFNVQIYNKAVIASIPEENIVLSAVNVKDNKYEGLYIETKKWVMTVNWGIYLNNNNNNVIMKTEDINNDGKKELIVILPFDKNNMDKNNIHIIDMKAEKEISVENPINMIVKKVENLKAISKDKILGKSDSTKNIVNNNIKNINNITWNIYYDNLKGYVQIPDDLMEQEYLYEVNYGFNGSKFVILNIKDVSNSLY